jgi:serine/threonine protein kinase
VKLADMGLARAVTDREAAKAEAGRAYGTPYYISPEQIRGELEIGPQADIYGARGDVLPHGDRAGALRAARTPRP